MSDNVKNSDKQQTPQQTDVKSAPKTGTGSQGSQDFSKFAAGPRSYGQSTGKKPAKAKGQFTQDSAAASSTGEGQFGQTSVPTTGAAGQFGQAHEHAAKGRGQFGQVTETSDKGRGQFGQEVAPKKGRGQYGQVAPSAMHSQSLSQRQEETIRSAHQQKKAEERMSMRFRILAASVAAVIVLSLIIGIAIAFAGSGEKTILKIDLIVGESAKTAYTVNETLDVTGLSVKVTYTDNSSKVFAVKEEWVSCGTLLDRQTLRFTAATGGKPINVTVTYRGIPKSFSVSVSSKGSVPADTVATITKVQLKKLVYDEGESLAEQGAEISFKRTGSDKVETVVINQNDTSKGNLNRFGAGLNWDWSPKDFSKNVSGSVKVTIKHIHGAELKIDVEVNGLDAVVGGIEISRPLITRYNVGDSLATMGMEVRAVMRDNVTKRVLQPSEYTIRPTTLYDAGKEVPIEVTYISPGSSYRFVKSFNVEVKTDLKENYNPKTQSDFPEDEKGLAIRTVPDKKTYTILETLETLGTNKAIPGFTLWARYDDGFGGTSKEEIVYVTRSMITSTDLDYASRFTKIGVTTLEIKYKGRTVKQNINVIDRARTLRVLNATKSFYQNGDFLDRIALDVTYNAINPLTGKSNQETLIVSGLQDAKEKGLEVVCFDGGYNVGSDIFYSAATSEQNPVGERNVQLYVMYGGMETALAVTVFNQIGVKDISVGLDKTTISINDLLDLSAIMVIATRVDGAYPDNKMEDIFTADRARFIEVESVADSYGNPENIDNIYSGPDSAREPNLKFSTPGQKFIKITYRGITSSIVSLQVNPA